MPLGSIGGYSLPYYTKENILTKAMIFKNFENDATLLQYLPSNPNLKTIPREFLLYILANVRREIMHWCMRNIRKLKPKEVL